ncbi:aTP-dependent helicase/nuclease subunit A [Clostridium sp. CAG:632]|nr:aTP-dependent helicase/nuclease subunit A [Clostridium sp. CAG:632]
MQWTKEQQAIIDNRQGTLLVSAAAGSGKTAALVPEKPPYWFRGFWNGS